MNDDDRRTYRKALAILEAAPETEGLDGITVESCYLNAQDTAREAGASGVSYENAVCEYFVAACRLYEIV